MRPMDRSPSERSSAPSNRGSGTHPFPFGQWPHWAPPTLALGLLLVIAACDFWLDYHDMPELPAVTYVLPIMLAAYVGGLRLGVVATGIALIAVCADMLPTFGSRPINAEELLRLISLTAAGALSSTLTEALRRATDRAKARQVQFAEVFNLNPAGSVLLRRRDLKLIAANDTYLSIIGHTRDEAVGRDVRELATLAPEDRDRIMARADDGESVRNQEITFRRRDGTARQGLLSMRVIDVDGEPHVLGVLMDVTDLRRAEAQAVATDERLQELAETINEVFWLSDPRTDEVVYISPGYQKVWGRSCEALYRSPKDWLDGVHPEDRPLVMQALAKQTAGYDEEYRIIRPDGGIRWIHDRAFPVRDATGAVVRVAGVAEDITERHQLRAQLQQTQRLESVGMLAGGVAHDFNNLLTVIMANADLIGDDPEPDDLREGVREISGAAERGVALTRQLLAFSRQELLEPRLVNVNAVVTDTTKMLRRLIGEDVELKIDLSPDVSPVLIDPGHFGQVLMNLAVNARDAMPRGGSLTLRTAHARVAAGDRAAGARMPGRYVAISLADTGSGMTPEVRAKIFEPFFTTKGPGRGTGLGLAVVHGIVTQSGGHIDVASTPGAGTTITILLPVAKGAAAAGRAEHEVPVGGSETILLVEDEDTVRRVAARALRAMGYSIIEARDGAEALSKVTRGQLKIDLLLTDVVMPRMDGRTLAESLAKWGDPPRVIYTSGYTDDAVLRHGVSRAEVLFLQKPYTSNALALKVREALDTAAALTSA